MSGWWKAPRELARMLAERELTLSAYALLHYLGESGADWPQGVATSNGFLAEALDLSDSTVRRGLRLLRDKRLIAYDDHERVAIFTVRTGEALRSLLDGPVTAAVTAGVTADEKKAAVTGQGSTARRAAPIEASPEAQCAVTSEAAKGPETETEIENHPSGGAHTLARGLVGELVTRYQERNGERPPREYVALAGRKLTEILDDGVSVPSASKALDRMLDRKLDPSMLPRLVADVAGAPPVGDALDDLAARVKGRRKPTEGRG